MTKFIADAIHDNIPTYKLMKKFMCEPFIPLNERNKEIIEELNQLKEIDKIFSKLQTKAIKLFHKRTGDIVISANTGIEFEKENLNGSHGGYLKEELYVPIIIISKNYELKYPLDYSSRTYSTLDVVPTIIKMSNTQLKAILPGHPI